MQKDKWHDLLYRSLDGTLSADEAAQLDDVLQKDDVLAHERDRLLQLRKDLTQLQPAPNARFARQVLRQLPGVEPIEASIRRLWPAVAAACVLTFSVGLGYIAFAEGDLTTTSLVGLDDDLLPEDVLVLDY